MFIEPLSFRAYFLSGSERIFSKIERFSGFEK